MFSDNFSLFRCHQPDRLLPEYFTVYHYNGISRSNPNSKVMVNDIWLNSEWFFFSCTRFHFSVWTHWLVFLYVDGVKPDLSCSTNLWSMNKYHYPVTEWRETINPVMKWMKRNWLIMILCFRLITDLYNIYEIKRPTLSFPYILIQ